MIKMKEGELKKRIVMTVAGVLLSGFAVGMFNASAFGMDPFQVFAHGVWGHTSITFGTFYMLLNLLMLVGVFFVDRSKIGLGTFINIFLLGYMVDFSTWIWNRGTFTDSILSRGIMLAVGVLLLCMASSLYFVGDLGVSTYDAVALCISQRKQWKFFLVRVTCDLVVAVTGFALGAVLGVGTLVSAFGMGPAITFFNVHMSEPLRYGKNLKK
jgi:uncharacterized membrane protein YczE